VRRSRSGVLTMSVGVRGAEGVGLRSVRAVAAALALTAAGPLVLSGCGGGADTTAPRPTATVTVAPRPVALTVGFFGSAPEVAAYQEAVDNYDAANQRVTLKLKTWRSAALMMRDLASGTPAPDIFLAERGDVDVLQRSKLTQPLDDLLAARNVDLGDGYSREALEAFSADHHLTCMPYAATPQVLFYNTDLVDFAAMKADDQPVPADLESGKWNLAQFEAAAHWAARPAQNISSFVQPTDIAGLAPYLYSGGGKVVDDEGSPTSLALSDDGNKAIWDTIVPALSDAETAATARQLRGHSALHWFRRGRLAMLVGDRSMVPTLREQAGLHWDVIGLPAVGGQATVGDYTGLCMSAASKEPQAAADLLAYLISRPAVSLVAHAGYIVPASAEVAMSPDFLQPYDRPAHAQVFVNASRSMHILPIGSTYLEEIDRQADGLIANLFRPGADVAALTQQIDAVSQPILAAQNAVLHPSPTATPTD